MSAAPYGRLMGQTAPSHDLRTLDSLRTSRVRRVIGWSCIIAALVGVAIALVALATSPRVGDDRFSYPQSATLFVVTELVLALQHLPLIAALLAFAAIVPSNVSRRGLVAAAIGMGLLTLAELASISAANVQTESNTATFVDSFFGVATVVIGVGLIVAGVSSVRSRWPGPAWIRWLPLATGAYVFAILIPATAMSDAALHWALAGWMALFLLIGLALTTPLLDPTAKQPTPVALDRRLATHRSDPRRAEP